MRTTTLLLIIGLALLLIIIVVVAFWGKGDDAAPPSSEVISGYDPPSTDMAGQFTSSQRAAALRDHYASKYQKVGIRVGVVKTMNKVEPGVYDTTFVYTKRGSNPKQMEKRVSYGVRNGKLYVSRVACLPIDELALPSEPEVATTTGQQGVTEPIVADRSWLLPSEYAYPPHSS